MKKNKWLITGIVISVMIGLIGTFLLWQKPKVRKTTFTFAYGEQIPNDSFTYLQYGFFHKDTTFDADIFSLLALGEHTIEVDFEDKTYSLYIQITDQTAPEIIFAEDELVYIYRQDDKFFLNKLFQIEDMSETTYEIEPKETNLRDGTQKICVKAKDVFDNTQEMCKEVNIKILEYDQTSNSFGVQDASVEAILQDYIQTNKLNQENFAFFYYSPSGKEEYIYNPDTMFNAASTIKVPLNMLYDDLKNKGDVSDETTYTLLASDIESGNGYTAIDYNLNQAVPLSYLQEQSIIYSDNTATNMLIRGLGGFEKYRIMLAKYSDTKLPASFYDNNETSAAYMFDVMKYLCAHRVDYASLIENMKQASKGQFLQASSDVFTIAQKYGEYDTYVNSIGIVYTPKPYIIGIFTNNVAASYNLITNINSSLIEYQLQK